MNAASHGALESQPANLWWNSAELKIVSRQENVLCSYCTSCATSRVRWRNAEVGKWHGAQWGQCGRFCSTVQWLQHCQQCHHQNFRRLNPYWRSGSTSLCFRHIRCGCVAILCLERQGQEGLSLPLAAPVGKKKKKPRKSCWAKELTWCTHLGAGSAHVDPLCSLVSQLLWLKKIIFVFILCPLPAPETDFSSWKGRRKRLPVFNDFSWNMRLVKCGLDFRVNYDLIRTGLIIPYKRLN